MLLCWIWQKVGIKQLSPKKKHQLNNLTFSKEINCNCLLLKSSCVSVAWQFQFFNGLLWSQGHEYPVWQIGFLKKITLKINLIKIKGLRVLLIFLLSPSFCIFSFFFFTTESFSFCWRYRQHEYTHLSTLPDESRKF